MIPYYPILLKKISTTFTLTHKILTGKYQPLDLHIHVQYNLYEILYLWSIIYIYIYSTIKLVKFNILKRQKIIIKILN
jgi:hypothetical protein